MHIQGDDRCLALMADKTHRGNVFLDMIQAHVKENTGHSESLGQALIKG